MNHTRKQAAAAYRERKRRAGIVAIRSRRTGETWVSRAVDLTSIANRIAFMCDHGAQPLGGLRDAWRAEGAEGFVVETLETIDDDVPRFARARVINDSYRAWCAMLGATPI
ncbi:GIY-YIG nuclease family protein [Acuticoccus mangrovi]|uniref:GIY-YIG nuclease family protein n=1 Tax=Acuticoccus mangrovi TaxID=2796142 RepID=A0A934IIY5_9HYPH|nr:GIY-YIG nuclease family protein [Acuticoccus mangrovi]MBJ3775846.1 GIY-YIG nuclease family protein [Acuticoccus mangrovi]